MARIVTLIRHGQTAANEEGRYAGISDEPLSRRGEAQAERLRPLMERLAPDAVVCSPLMRAAQTARIAAGRTGAPLEYDEGLREVDFGEWENLTFAQILERYPAHARRWMEKPDEFRFPGGESAPEFARRVDGAVRRLFTRREEVVAAFTHGGVIGYALCGLMDLPGSRHMMFRIAPASAATLELVEGTVALRNVLPVTDWAEELV